jgi:hypothetical protein
MFPQLYGVGIIITKEYIMEKNRFRQLLESDLGNVKPLVFEQATDYGPNNDLDNMVNDDKNNLVTVLIDKLTKMKDDVNFSADDVYQTILNNLNHFKNKTDIFAK